MRNILKKDRSRLIAAAMDRIPCDLSIENTKLVNTVTGEIYPASVDIIDGCIARVRAAGESAGLPSGQVIDADGAYLLPGFIDSHMHVESSLMVPENFGKAAVVWGTTTAVTDPHEIANVLGKAGIEYMEESSFRSPLRQFLLVSSCVPSLPGLETAGAEISAEDVKEMLGMKSVIGVAELMDYYGVIEDDARMRDIIAAGEESGGFLQGHAPCLTGKELNAYIASGIQSDHESIFAAEVLEKLRLGMHVDLRLHSQEQAGIFMEVLKDEKLFLDNLCVCTDDVNAARLQSLGHINCTLSRLINAGLDPLKAVKLATLNPAREYDFADLGAVAPGYAADIQLVRDLSFKDHPLKVFVEGKLVAENGKYLGEPACKAAYGLGNTVYYVGISGPEDFMPASDKDEAEVIYCNKGYETQEVFSEKLPVRDGHAYIPEEKRGNFNYICVLNRYGKPNKQIFLYDGFGLNRGAIASSIGHDCHNICVLYADPADAYAAVEALKKAGGGVCYVKDGELTAMLNLPVAGLMSDMPLEVTAAECDKVQKTIAAESSKKDFTLHDIIFKTLPVFPCYTPTDLGLVDGPKRSFVTGK